MSSSSSITRLFPEENPNIFTLMEKMGIVQKAIQTNVNVTLPEGLKNEDEIVSEIVQTYMVKMQPLLTEKLLPAFLEIYQEKFTEEELAELIKFYNTDLGKKVLEADNELFAEAIGEVIVECNDMMLEAQKEVLEKHGYDKKSKKKKRRKK